MDMKFLDVLLPMMFEGLKLTVLIAVVGIGIGFLIGSLCGYLLQSKYKVIALYKDYEEQMKAKKDPYYNPDKISWSGVDKEMWKDINKKYIENDK